MIAETSMSRVYSSHLNEVKQLEPELTPAVRWGTLLRMELIKHAAPRSIDAIAERLRVTRLALGMRQNAFAGAAGVAPNAYNQWERAKGRPDIDGAQALCDGHGLTLDWIYRGDASSLSAGLVEKIRAKIPKVAAATSRVA